MKLTQKQRILEALRAHPEGVSTRYLKRELGITETNGRISELRAEGFNINAVGEDEFGFTIQKLMGEPVKKVRKIVPVLDEKGRQIAVREVISYV